jgi:biopolymer transport protein ExbB
MAIRTLRFVLAALILLLPTLSHAWWNKDWKQREKVELNTSAQGVETKETLTGVVLAVRLHLGNFSFTDAKPDGSDLRFVAADDKTVLKHFVERFDAANGLAVIWVQVPTLAGGNAAQALWLYHGNPAAPAAEDAKGVYDAGTVAFNFSETDGIARDGGSNGVTPTTKPAGIEQAGLLGASAVFRGEAMVLPDAAVLRRTAGGTMTFSLWVKPAAAAVTKAAIYQQDNLELALDSGTLSLRAAGKVVAKGGQVKPDAWQHLGLAVGNGKALLYLDGIEVGNAPLALSQSTGDVRIGEGLLGVVDAVQISSAQRSADWFKVAAKSQGADGNFANVTPEASEEGGGSSYFGILFANLTTDAWVVIGILGVMFVIAAYVMVTKARLVGITDTANRHFLKRFRDAGEDFIAIGNSPEFAHSTLYKLYEAAIHQMRKRHVGANVGAAAAPLSNSSINAIKAAIDADMVREMHHLNAKMVLLTIAISGGPFLGLLGTVVGVMITFAAIAAAGDVNVNAIAPGIAAALLATVAGLAVAIPSLFGYNYLASRIKNISADMQIFVDELVTRVAEQYGLN